ncbi:hypothetical protein [Silvanigrella aquatica]|uniref:Uncharacterized protein n=1 Tax=Silvanigrella aquatica TaxID=1915309 RepID=A0A1L4D0P2_9BACT|nr:hypothetical protein [Silvanigrella aquatica]APJ03771.1 hypothetical protein AXG55_07570 [Silvanigrella aquatica]
MSSLCFYITEYLGKNIKQPQLDAITTACQEASYDLKTNISNQEILNSVANENDFFILSSGTDFQFFVTNAKEHLKHNFILFPSDKELSLFEKHKEEMKEIRFLIGLLHNQNLKIIIKHILTFYKSSNETYIFNNYNLENVPSFMHVLSNSSERATIQTKVTEFFSEEMQKNNSHLVAGTSSYPKIFGDVVDEFLMNAIWDACPTRNTIDRTQPVALPENERIDLNCLFDGLNLVLTVSDKFGTFQSKGITKYIRHALGFKENEAVKEGTPGAGLGLFMILQKIGILIFEVYQGKITRATIIARGDHSIREVQKKPKTVLFFEK